MKKYFEIPTQVLFYSKAEGGWAGGIAYKDTVIDIGYGDAYPIEEIYQTKPEWLNHDPIFLYYDWCSLTKEMVGETIPPNLVWKTSSVLIEKEKEN